MSKLAILKNLPTPSDVRENVQQLGQMLAETSQRLDQTARQVQSLEQLPSLVAEQVTEALSSLDQVVTRVMELERLPSLVAEQVTQALSSLDSLIRLPDQVQVALIAFDKVNQVQRSALGSLADEMSSRASEAMQQKVGMLDPVLIDLSNQVKALKLSMTAMKATTQKLAALPEDLSKTTQYSARLMQNESKQLISAAHAVRPRVFRDLLLMLGSAVLGALLVATGQAGLNRLLPPTETQQSADWAGRVWSRATESEKKLLTQIVSRPDK